MEKEGQERADSKFSFDDFVRFYTDGDFSLVTPELRQRWMNTRRSMASISRL